MEQKIYKNEKFSVRDFYKKLHNEKCNIIKNYIYIPEKKLINSAF